MFAEDQIRKEQTITENSIHQGFSSNETIIKPQDLCSQEMKKKRRTQQNEMSPGKGGKCLINTILQFSKLRIFNYINSVEGKNFIRQNKKLTAIFYDWKGQYKKCSRKEEYPHIFKAIYTNKNIWDQFFHNEVLQKELKRSQCAQQNKKLFKLLFYRFQQVRESGKFQYIVDPTRVWTLK